MAYLAIFFFNYTLLTEVEFLGPCCDQQKNFFLTRKFLVMKKKNMKSCRTIFKDARMVLNEEKDQFRVRDLKPLQKV